MTAVDGTAELKRSTPLSCPDAWDGAEPQKDLEVRESFSVSGSS